VFIVKTILLAIALALPAAPALGQEQPAPEIEVFRDDDVAMTCRQISDEAAALSEQMGGEGGGGVFGRLGGVARSGASMVIPGAGLAFAGADLLTSPGRERRAAREAAVDHRWYFLNGLFTGKRCDEELAATPPQVQVVPSADD
jgi:hypothetical protein